MPLGDRFPQVLSAAREGADWAWAELYRDLAPVLFRFMVTLGAPEPEDCLGECFLQLVRHVPTFRGDESAFRAWAFRVARNRVIDGWRAADRHRVSPSADMALVFDRLVQQAPADERILRRDAVLAVLAKLNTDQRTVVLLRTLDQFSVAETAVIMGRSEGAVRVLQSRAIKNLRKLLTAH